MALVSFQGIGLLQKKGLSSRSCHHFAATKVSPIRPGRTDDAHTLVAGFATEALLKALLALDGLHEPELKKLGHNLETLWSNCAAKGLLPPSAVPAWVIAVNVFHNNPFFIRYKTGGGLYSLPSKTEVHAGLFHLNSEVAACIAAKSAA